MEIGKHTILGFFNYYNLNYFNGELPMPIFKIRHSYRTLGYFHSNIDEFGNLSNETIEISDKYDYTEEQFRDILIHEMIHYYLLYKRIDIKCHHGKEFKNMSADFNIRYNMNITSKIDLSSYKIRHGKSNILFKLCTFF